MTQRAIALTPLRLIGRLSPEHGPWQALILYLLAGAVLMAFLFATVHRRTPAEIRGYASFQGFPEIIQVWIEHGYLKHGGLAFRQPASANPTQKVWRSNSMAFLQGAHLLERVSYAVTGQYSYRLMTVHNQSVIWLTAAAIGLLCMRLAMRLGVIPGRAFLLGLAGQAVYQTFPQNLLAYWELLPTAVVLLVAVSWLLVEETRFDRELDEKTYVRLRMLFVFVLAWLEPYGTVFLLVTFVLAFHLLAPEDRRRIPVLRSIVWPAVAGIGLLIIQVLWVRYNYPLVTLWSTGFLERTGLDGSTEYIQGHWDLLTRRWPYPDWPVNFWKALFLSGVVALVAVAVLRLVSRLPLRSAIFVLCVSLGLYLPFAFAAVQATAIHPYGYDIYLLFPLIVALFAVLPAAVEALTRHTGLLVFASLLAAWCFAWVQLRTYAIQFPLLP